MKTTFVSANGMIVSWTLKADSARKVEDLLRLTRTVGLEGRST